MTMIEPEDRPLDAEIGPATEEARPNLAMIEESEMADWLHEVDAITLTRHGHGHLPDEGPAVYVPLSEYDAVNRERSAAMEALVTIYQARRGLVEADVDKVITNVVPFLQGPPWTDQ